METFASQTLQRAVQQPQTWQFFFNVMKKIKLTCQYFQRKIRVTSKLEVATTRMAITVVTPLDSIMGRQPPLVDIERNQKFDDAVVKRLAKILEDLQNLED